MKKIINNSLIFIFGIIFLISAYSLYTLLIGYKKNIDTYNNISEIVTTDDNNIYISNTEYDKLKLINDDYLFWISIPNTNINYPVVKSKDNEDYLYTNFINEPNKGGSIFLDAGNSLDYMNDDNLVIHGHNMKDKSMFGSLSKFLTSEYLSENKIIYIYLEDKILEYEVFSAYVTDGETFPYVYNFLNNDEFNNYLNLVISKSYNSLNYFDDGKRNLLTLSTCTNATGNKRTIVNAKLKNIKEN